jgi:hypothetical protein
MEMVQFHAPSFLDGPWADVVIENGHLRLALVTCIEGKFML